MTASAKTTPALAAVRTPSETSKFCQAQYGVDFPRPGAMTGAKVVKSVTKTFFMLKLRVSKAPGTTDPYLLGICDMEARANHTVSALENSIEEWLASPAHAGRMPFEKQVFLTRLHVEDDGSSSTWGIFVRTTPDFQMSDYLFLRGEVQNHLAKVSGTRNAVRELVGCSMRTEVNQVFEHELL